MKKIFALALALCLVLALAACGNSPASSASTDDANQPDTASADDIATTDIVPDENAATADEEVPIDDPAATPAEGTSSGSDDAAASGSADGLISEADAESIALTDAGVSEADTVYLHTHLDRDDGRQVYDVEFYAGNTEYDYEIDASSGAILSVDNDIENYDGSGAAAASSGEVITPEEAANIALTDAGVSEADTLYLYTELDRDDGRQVYDVEFYAGNTEYDYEIDANSGDIRSVDNDIENYDGHNVSASVSVDLESATATALADAGVSEDQVIRLRAELDEDDGRLYYEIDFIYNELEYEYEVDANSGKIVSTDRESIYD